MWYSVARGGALPADPDAEWLQTLANLISHAGLAALVPDAEDHLGLADIQQSRLLNRFRRKQGVRWAERLDGAGIPVMAIKGLASAHAVWPDPDGRAVSDADLLVHRRDLGRALEVLLQEGFGIADMPTRSRWGFISEASFQPLIHEEDGSNIDLHVEAAAWPMARALPVDELMARGEPMGGGGVSRPCATDALLIASAHAAGDGFGQDGIKSVIDGLLLLRTPEAIDFAGMAARARRARMLKPLRVYLALLKQLGADLTQAREAGLALDRVSGPTFEAAVTAHLTCFRNAAPLTGAARLRQELALCTEVPIFLHRNWRRLTGLIRPHKGLPG